MKFRNETLVLLLSIISTFALGQSQRVPSIVQNLGRQEGDHHTKIRLLANVKTITPGAQFTVGLLMRMDEGWHTYWKNSGEAGLPTQIEWMVPEGFVAGEIQWPVPHKYNEGGEVLTYGYERENMLLIPMTAPRTLKLASKVSLKADVNWLECERICVPGSGSVELTLPVSVSQGEKDNVALFNKYRDQIPEMLSLESDLTIATETRAGRVELHLSATGASKFVVENDVVPDFYPEAIEELQIGRTQVTASAADAYLRIPLSVYKKVDGPLLLRGVLVYRLESAERTVGVVEVPLSKEFVSAVPIFGETVPAFDLLDQTFATVEGAAAQQPLYLYVIFAIIGGLLLNIMPCVLPVIALKVFGLVKMGGDHPRQVRRLGWFFSLGILGSFLVLALMVIILQTAGEQIGWGFQFQEPMFVIVMSAIVFAFGLSLFGVYEIRLPGRAVAGVGDVVSKTSKGGKGYLSSFSEGVFATILATPCTAPFLGSALGFAFAQPPGVILLIFTSTSFGMALPYLILTTKPGWLRFLPKPGGWMVTAKQFMGFLMMATLIWLLYILGKQLGMEAVIWTSAFLLAVSVACWLIGRFATLTASRGTYRTTWAVAVAIAVLGYWGFIESILDVRSVIAGVPSTSQAVVTKNTDGIPWEPFSLARLEAYLQDDKTVFIDFTADWCLTCKVNERVVLTDESVVEEFRSRDIVPIKADWTKRNPDITRLLAKFGRAGVPLYVIFPAGRPTEPIVLPEVITTGMVIDAIDRATRVTSAGVVR
ncbi:MAG: protein-disulfide reductase DsbD family protein [Ignavibacteria bacterium]|nr:protein-disulfide reductase DsbD family protein [Ignavibacteria bacterium]